MKFKRFLCLSYLQYIIYNIWAYFLNSLYVTFCTYFGRPVTEICLEILDDPKSVDPVAIIVQYLIYEYNIILYI